MSIIKTLIMTRPSRLVPPPVKEDFTNQFYAGLDQFGIEPVGHHPVGYLWDEVIFACREDLNLAILNQVIIPAKQYDIDPFKASIYEKHLFFCSKFLQR